MTPSAIVPTPLVAAVIPAVVQPVAAAAPVAVPTPHKLTAREHKLQVAHAKAVHAAEVKAEKVKAAQAVKAAKAAHNAKKAK